MFSSKCIVTSGPRVLARSLALHVEDSLAAPAEQRGCDSVERCHSFLFFFGDIKDDYSMQMVETSGIKTTKTGNDRREQDTPPFCGN